MILAVPAAIASQASSDTQLIKLWIHGRSEHTQAYYQTAAERFLAFAGISLQQATLSHLQGFADSLGNLSPGSQKTTLSAVKSLLSFGQKVGYLSFNVGAALKLPKVKDTLAERILSETDVQTLIALEPNTRNRVLLRLLYASGGRVSELCGLKWKDTQERKEAGQITLYGKGGKTRVVLLSEGTWKELLCLRKEVDPDKPVFSSRRRSGHLSRVQLLRIVQAAANRAGIKGKVSPHWFRHSHASHALDRGCPIHLVQATLGHSSVATTGRYLHAKPEDSSARYLGL